MTKELCGAEALPLTQCLFYAADASTVEPKLAVEARTEEEARHRLQSLLEWYQFGTLKDLVVLRLDGAMPAGLPVFLDAFFFIGNFGSVETGTLSGENVH